MFVKKNMTHLVLDIKKESDLQELLPLLKRLKIRFSKTELPAATPENERAEALKILQAGGDFSYFGDAAEWQHEQRQDRPLPTFDS